MASHKITGIGFDKNCPHSEHYSLSFKRVYFVIFIPIKGYVFCIFYPHYGYDFFVEIFAPIKGKDLRMHPDDMWVNLTKCLTPNLIQAIQDWIVTRQIDQY